MIKLLVEKLPRILKNKKKFEKELGIKISNRGKEVFLEGTPENEFVAEKAIQAIDFGFPLLHAMAVKNENCVFEKINIKEHAKQKNFERIRARLIGKKGKTLKTISHLADCFLELNGNEIGVVGDAEKIEITNNAIVSLIKGSKQSNIYSYLEKHQAKPVIDLGLKDKFKSHGS